MIEQKSFEIFLTVISGVFIFIFSQFILKIIIESIVEYRRTIGRIDNKLKFYSNIIVTPPFGVQDLPKNYLDAKELFRDLSCELESNYKIIPFKKIFIKMGFILRTEAITTACTDLIWISNTTGHKDDTKTLNMPLLASEKIDKIRESLNIKSI